MQQTKNAKIAIFVIAALVIVFAVSLLIAPIAKEIISSLIEYYKFCKAIPQNYERNVSTALSLIAVPMGLCLGYYYYVDKRRLEKKEHVIEQKTALLRETENVLRTIQNEIYALYAETDSAQLEIRKQRVWSSADAFYALLSNFSKLYPEHTVEFSPLYALYSFVDQIDVHISQQNYIGKYGMLHTQAMEMVINTRLARRSAS